MGKYDRKLNVVRFKHRVPCPYLPCTRTFPSNLSLCRHALQHHNWNKDWKEKTDERQI